MRRSVETAVIDARLAVVEFDEAVQWLGRVREKLMDPLAVEVWVFDEDLTQVLLVNHRWRGWVPPGGKVEPGESPRDAAGWMRLDRDWDSYFPDDPPRMRWHAKWLAGSAA